MEAIRALVVGLNDVSLPYLKGDGWLVSHVADETEAIVSFYERDFQVLVLRHRETDVVRWLRSHPGFDRLTVVFADVLDVCDAGEVLAVEDARAV